MSQGRIIRVHLPLLYPCSDANYQDEKINANKKPLTHNMSQGQIIRVHLPLLYPCFDTNYRDEKINANKKPQLIT
jgi:hypothetical protein